MTVLFWLFVAVAVVAAVEFVSSVCLIWLYANAPLVGQCDEKPGRPTEQEPPEFGTKWEATP